MKQIKMNGQYFEKLTSRKEAAAWLKETKENAVDFCDWNGKCILPDEGGLFIEYLNGETMLISDGDDFTQIRTYGVKTMIYDGGYGYTFYNAVPQMDLAYPDMPLIRIGTECHEYGETVKM